MTGLLPFLVLLVVLGGVIILVTRSQKSSSTTLNAARTPSAWDEALFLSAMTRVFGGSMPGTRADSRTFQRQAASGVPLNFWVAWWHGEEQADRGVAKTSKANAKHLIMDMGCQLHINRHEVRNPDAILADWEGGLQALQRHLAERDRASAELTDDGQTLRFSIKREKAVERALSQAEAQSTFDQLATEWNDDLGVFAEVSLVNPQHT